VARPPAPAILKALSWDGNHPTAFAHAAIAQQFPLALT
jgi:hypothetical protein